MDLLKRELERKKKAVEAAKKKAPAATATGSGSRYVKAVDLRRHQDEQEEAQLLMLRQSSSSLTSSKRRKLMENDFVDTDAGPTVDESQSEQQMKDKIFSDDTDTPVTSCTDTDPSSEKNLSTNIPQHKQSSLSASQLSSSSSSLAEIKQQLRVLGLPVTLFGELQSIEQRIQRLENAERALRDNQLHRSEADEFRLGKGHGIRNPFLEKDRGTANHNNNTDQALLQAEAAAALAPPVRPNNQSITTTSTGGTSAQKRKKQHDESGEGGNAAAAADDDDDNDDPHKFVYKHFKGLLQQWEADLNARTDEVKRTVAGRNETKTLKQCRDYIRPLFKLCKRRQLEDNMLDKLADMVQHCRAGEFVKAHDAYMDLAIGRSAWPIGVTQVGIHSRTGREKIGANNVAHVMNSELQRKYLTSVKRLLTYEQKKRTDVDPSKKVMN